jgi:hypothetical protein
MLIDIFSSNISLALICFSDLNLVTVILTESSELLLTLFEWICVFFLVAVRKYFQPVVNSDIIRHVICELFAIILELFINYQALKFQQSRGYQSILRELQKTVNFSGVTFWILWIAFYGQVTI